MWYEINRCVLVFLFVKVDKIVCIYLVLWYLKELIFVKFLELCLVYRKWYIRICLMKRNIFFERLNDKVYIKVLVLNIVNV